jgi:hypothetical protein
VIDGRRRGNHRTYLSAKIMSTWSTAGRHALFLSVSIFFGTLDAYAQIKVSDIALKSGESAEMGITYWITRGANCRSTLEKIEGVEVLEGPPELTITIKEEIVLPNDCAKKVPGGRVVISVKDVTAPYHGKLVYRIKFKTKDGSRQSSYIYNVALYP